MSGARIHWREMLVAHRGARPQIPDDAEHVDRDIRTVGPIADVLGEDFFAAVGSRETRSDHNLRHL